MGNISPEYQRKIKELSNVKHLMNDTFESWPRGFHGPEDKGGFFENMEYALAHDYALSPKRREVLDRMYNKYVLGTDGKLELKSPELVGDGNAFTMDRAGGQRAPEGWRIKVDGIVVGTPITREHAYIIGAWLKNSIPALERYFMQQVVADTKQAEEIVEI